MADDKDIKESEISNAHVEDIGDAAADPKQLQTERGKDKAAELLASAGGRIDVTPEQSAKVLRKIDLVLLPILLTVYALQSLDKTALSYASVFDLIEDAHLVGDQYSWLGSIVYLAQLVMQPIIAVMLVKLPIGKFISGMVLLWGIIMCCMVAAHNFAGLLVTRLFLGAAEAAVGQSWHSIL
jgi:hypothetical protein